MLGLRLPERPGWRQLGDYLSWPDAGCIDIRNRVFSDPLLLVARVIDCGTIAWTEIITLAIGCARIVNLEKEFQQPAVADLRGIEHDLHRFGMGAVIAIGRIGNIAAAVAHARRDHAVLLAKKFLYAPEATVC